MTCSNPRGFRNNSRDFNFKHDLKNEKKRRHFTLLFIGGKVWNQLICYGDKSNRSEKFFKKKKTAKFTPFVGHHQKPFKWSYLILKSGRVT